MSVSFHRSVSSVHVNQFLVQGLGSIQSMSDVTSTAPLSHEELEIDYEALDETVPDGRKTGALSSENEAAIKFKFEGGWHGRTLQTLAVKEYT